MLGENIFGGVSKCRVFNGLKLPVGEERQFVVGAE